MLQLPAAQLRVLRLRQRYLGAFLHRRESKLFDEHGCKRASQRGGGDIAAHMITDHARTERRRRRRPVWSDPNVQQVETGLLGMLVFRDTSQRIVDNPPRVQAGKLWELRL